MTPLASPATSAATRARPAACAQKDGVGPRASAALESTTSPPSSATSASARGAIGIEDENRLAPAACQRAAMFPPDEPDLHSWSMKERARAPRCEPQDWLKKPFSMSSARSSALICTLRGVSMKTLWAIRCMPPSSA